MIKTTIVSLVMLIVLSALGVAYANGPPANHTDIDLLVDDYAEISNIEMHIVYYDYDWLEQDNHKIITYTEYDIINAEKTRKDSERIINYRDSDVEYFYLEVTIKSGEVVTTQHENHVYYGTYKFSTKDNTLVGTKIISRHLELKSIFRTLLVALIFTIFIEMMVGITFSMYPIEHILKINVTTNLIMNIIVLATLYFFIVDYAILILALEIMVVVVESLYYIGKYRNKTKLSIITYTIIANIISWGIYSIINFDIY